MKISRAQKAQSVQRDQHYRLMQGTLGNGSYQTEQEAECGQLWRCVCLKSHLCGHLYVCVDAFVLSLSSS